MDNKEFLPEFDFDLNEGLDIEDTNLKNEKPSEDAIDEELEEDSEDLENDDLPEDGTEENDDLESPEKDENLEKLFNIYVSNGFIDEKFKGDFKGTAESFAEILEKQQEEKELTLREQILESVHPNYKDFVKILLNKGENISPEDFQNYLSASAANDLSEDDFNDEEIASTFLKSYFMNTFGDTEEEAQEKIESFGEKVVEKAKLVFRKEKDIQDKLLKKAAEESDEEYKLRKQQKEEFRKGLFEEIKTAPYKPSFKKKITTDLKTGKFKESLSQITSDPKSLIQLAAIVSFFDSNKKEFDFEKIVKTVATKDVKNLKKSIEEALSSNSNKRVEKAGKSKQVQYDFIV